MKRFVGSWIPFLDWLFCLLCVYCLGEWNQCGWCLAIGRVCWLNWPQVRLEYFIIPYTYTFIGFSHLYQGCHVHWVAIANDRGMGGLRLIYIRVWVVGAVSGYDFIIFAFVVAVTSSFPSLRWLQHDGCCACFVLFFLILSLASLATCYWCIAIVVPVV